MCGGTCPHDEPECYAEGLSPRVRGNPYRWPVVRIGCGSIPACAGEPVACAISDQGPSVYPRVCGGTYRIAYCCRDGDGLSPRVRGNPVFPLLVGAHRRSIPACAGEPPLGRARDRAGPVYPRVCGGTDDAKRGRDGCEGLSPLVRGNPNGLCRPGYEGGSIPACAGEPASWQRCAGTVGVYPRVCGGTARAVASRVSIHGLSPRVRGNHRALRGVARCAGSIPACAGEPRSNAESSCSFQVYPRVCGGTRSPLGDRLYVEGLSPRVRGNRLSSMMWRDVHRSIPACAGEPMIQHIVRRAL